MEDRGARLWPRHLWGLRLWGLRAEAGNGKGATWVRNILKHRHITTAVPSCSEQKSNPAVVQTPPTCTQVEQNCLTLVDGAQCWLWVNEKMDKHGAHSIKRTGEYFLITSLWPCNGWLFCGGLTVRSPTNGTSSNLLNTTAKKPTTTSFSAGILPQWAVLIQIWFLSHYRKDKTPPQKAVTCWLLHLQPLNHSRLSCLALNINGKGRRRQNH